MKDYQDIWIKWIGFLSSDKKIREETLQSVHEEVRKGFSVIATMAVEELAHDFSQKDFFSQIKQEVEDIFTYSVWSGYALFLISERIDPVKAQLHAKTQTTRLGDVWMENYEKDKNNSLLLKIDPIFGLFMQSIVQNGLNKLFTHHESHHIVYKDFATLASLLQWVAYQGYIFGVLEQQLIREKKEQ